jgi:hypothetical protein
MKPSTLLVMMAMLLCNQAIASNTPCSGKKGGISFCQNGKFICNDGSISGSKKVCPVGLYGTGEKKK